MAAQQLARLKARSEATCDRLQGDIFAIRQQKVPQGFCDLGARHSCSPFNCGRKLGRFPMAPRKIVVRLNYQARSRQTAVPTCCSFAVAAVLPSLLYHKCCYCF